MILLMMQEEMVVHLCKKLNLGRRAALVTGMGFKYAELWTKIQKLGRMKMFIVNSI